jgi:peptidoglycan-N-acetylglucosamine deacetylase
VAGWLGSYGGEDSPGDISRGVFAGDIGMPRLVQLFERFGMKQFFFIPGHTIESFPMVGDAIRFANHQQPGAC